MPPQLTIQFHNVCPNQTQENTPWQIEATRKHNNTATPTEHNIAVSGEWFLSDSRKHGRSSRHMKEQYIHVQHKAVVVQYRSKRRGGLVNAGLGRGSGGGRRGAPYTKARAKIRTHRCPCNGYHECLCVHPRVHLTNTLCSAACATVRKDCQRFSW